MKKIAFALSLLLASVSATALASYCANEGFVSTSNSSATPLSGAATFTGTGEDVSNYSVITVFVDSDVDGTLKMQLSSDNTNWDRSKNVPVDITVGSGSVHTLEVVSQYFRVVYVNGAGAQSHFRLQTIYHKTKSGFLTSSPDQSVSRIDDVQLNRTVNTVDLDLSRGLFADKFVVQKFGANEAVANGAEEFIWNSGSATYPWPTAAETVRIKAGGDPNDISSGTRAREITVEGLDENWERASETIATNGSSASSATTTTFIRINRAFVSAVGTYGATNLGAIEIENTSTNDVIGYIGAGLGQTETSGYTVPANCTAYLTRVQTEVEATKPGEVRMWNRRDADDTSAPMGPTRLVHRDLGLDGVQEMDFKSYRQFPAKTDLWMTGIGNGASTGIDVDYDLWVMCYDSASTPQ